MKKRFPGGRFVAVNGDGTLIATYGNEDVVVRSIDSGDVLATLADPARLPSERSLGLVTPSQCGTEEWPGRYGFGVTGTSPTRSSIPARKPHFSLTFEETQISPDGDLIALDAQEVWSMSTREMKYKIPGVEPVHASFSTDGRLGILDYPEAGAPGYSHGQSRDW